jgi:hypothetical protein
MKKLFSTLVLAFVFLSNSVHAQCTKNDYLNLTAFVGGSVIVGAGVGVAVAATMPVAGTTALAGSFFTVGAGKAALGTWVTTTVVPMAAAPSVMLGLVSSVIAIDIVSKECFAHLSK